MPSTGCTSSRREWATDKTDLKERKQMKLIIASDIHGSALCCRKLLEACDREEADRILLLGDILYHGPRNDLPEGYAPKEVIAALNAWKDEILCVRGNCEAEVDQMVLKFPVMADYAVLFIDGYRIYATHGHVYHPDRLPPLQPGISSSTATPMCRHGKNAGRSSA